MTEWRGIRAVLQVSRPAFRSKVGGAPARAQALSPQILARVSLLDRSVDTLRSTADPDVPVVSLLVRPPVGKPCFWIVDVEGVIVGVRVPRGSRGRNSRRPLRRERDATGTVVLIMIIILIIMVIVMIIVQSAPAQARELQAGLGRRRAGGAGGPPLREREREKVSSSTLRTTRACAVNRRCWRQRCCAINR